MEYHIPERERSRESSSSQRQTPNCGWRVRKNWTRTGLMRLVQMQRLVAPCKEVSQLAWRPNRLNCDRRDPTHDGWCHFRSSTPSLGFIFLVSPCSLKRDPGPQSFREIQICSPSGSSSEATPLRCMATPLRCTADNFMYTIITC